MLELIDQILKLSNSSQPISFYTDTVNYVWSNDQMLQKNEDPHSKFTHKNI